MRGKFIAFEGADGSGKSTVINAMFKEFHRNTEVVREPGFTDVGEAIRDILLNRDLDICPKTEALLMASSRAELVNSHIIPRLNEGYNIFSDRYVLSSLVYQGISRNLGINEIREINNFATSGLKADQIIFLDIDYETQLRRREERKTSDRIEKEDAKFHKSVIDGYKKIYDLFKDEYNIVKVDATKSLDQVIEICKKHIIEIGGK